jgi:uncharacterized membrane protein YfcA
VYFGFIRVPFDRVPAGESMSFESIFFDFTPGTPIWLLVLFLVALGLATFASLIGTSGGSAMVAILITMLYLPYQVAIATATIFGAADSIVSIIRVYFSHSKTARRKKQLKDDVSDPAPSSEPGKNTDLPTEDEYRDLRPVLRAWVVLAPFAILGSFLGATISFSLPDVVLRITQGVVIIVLSVRMIRSALKRRKKGKRESKAGVTASTFQMSKRAFVVLATTGTCVGLLAGLVGMGGGMIMVPMLATVLNFTFFAAGSTSELTIIVALTSSSLMRVVMGGFDPLYAAIVVVGATLGAWSGTALWEKVPETPVMVAFAGMALVLAVRLIITI